MFMASYTIHPGYGFVLNWVQLLQVSFAIGLYAALTVNYAASAAFATLGLLLNNQTLTAIGSAASTPFWTFVFGSVIIWFSIAIFLLGLKAVRVFIKIIFVPAVLGTVIALALLLVNTHASFVTRFNSILAPYTHTQDSYDQIIQTAKSLGFSIPKESLLASIMALPLGFYAFLGYNQSIVVSGEIKNISRTQPLAIILAFALTTFVCTLAFERFYQVVGWDFTNAVGYLFYVEPSKYPLPVPPVLNFFAGLLTSNAVLNVLMGISFILWVFMLVGPLYLITSRYMFSWSFARIMPEFISRVDKRGSPWVAVLISGVLSQVFLTLYVYTTLLSIVNYTLLFATFSFLYGLVFMLFPYLKKQDFERSPSFVKAKIGSVPLMTIFAVIDTLFFGFIIYFSVINPAFSGPIGLSSYSMIIALYVTGVVAYLISSALRKRQGISFKQVWSEIPPE